MSRIRHIPRVLFPTSPLDATSDNTPPRDNMDLDAVDEGSGQKKLHHKTLSTYYPHLETLHDYLAWNAPYALAYYSDSSEYRDLLATTICAPHGHSAPFPPFTNPTATQQEIIDIILQDLGTRGAKGDALVLGTNVSRLDTSSANTQASGSNYNFVRPGVEIRYSGTASFVLHEEPWKILRNRWVDVLSCSDPQAGRPRIQTSLHFHFYLSGTE